MLWQLLLARWARYRAVEAKTQQLPFPVLGVGISCIHGIPHKHWWAYRVLPDCCHADTTTQTAAQQYASCRAFYAYCETNYMPNAWHRRSQAVAKIFRSCPLLAQ